MATDTIKIVLHIDEELDDHSRDELQKSLIESQGIVEAHINEQLHHLMLVDYKPQMIDTNQVLKTVISKGVHAELIGGI